MIRRNFTTIHHLYAFAIALFVSLLSLRGFELFSTVELNSLSQAFKVFLAGFWNDMGLVLLSTMALGVISFCISFLDKKISLIAGGILGFLLLLISSLLTFYGIATEQAISVFEFGIFASLKILFTNAFQSAALLPNLIFLFFGLGIFMVLYIFARGIRNGKMILICISLFVGQSLFPPVKKMISLEDKQKIYSSNKVVSFLSKDKESAPFEIPSQYFSNVKEHINEAGFSVDWEAPSMEIPLMENVKNFATPIENSNLLEDGTEVNIGDDDLFIESRKMAHEGKYDEAQMRVTYLIKKNKENADYFYLQGLISAWQGEYQAALASCQKALDLSPHYQDIYLSIADIHYWNGDKTQAIHILDSGIVNLGNPEQLYVKKEQLRLAK